MPRQTAPDPLPLGGKLFAIDHYQVAPLAGASVTLRRRADDQVLASAVTASDGMYAMSVASGGVALDAYFAISAAGFVDARLDPISPISDGDNGLMVVATEAEIARWYVDANLTYAPGSPVVIAAVVDCDRMALGGTTDVVSPTASITYYDDAAQRWDPALAASTNGFALIANPAATTSVTAHRDTTVYPAHAIAAPAATLTVATVQPYQ